MNHKDQVRATFDAVAEGYDLPSLHFFQDSADQLPALFNFKGDEQVLDVATGTGTVALTLAGQLPRGKVTGIDFSTRMLAQAKQRLRDSGLQNVDFLHMDMEVLDLPPASFDAANCSFGLFFVERMLDVLNALQRVVKPGGLIVTSAFHESSFMPQSELLLNRLQARGVEAPTLSLRRLDTEEKNENLFRSAGLHSVQTRRVDLSDTLESAQQWWEIVWNAGYRGLINRLADDDARQFREEHMDEIEALREGTRIPLTISVIYSWARVPQR